MSEVKKPQRVQDVKKSTYSITLADSSVHCVVFGFPLPADVNRALWGGGVPEDRTHSAYRNTFEVQQLSSVLQLWGFSQEGNLAHPQTLPGAPFSASKTQLPL